MNDTEDESFTEFPADEALRDFDKSDRKFVAVAAAYGSDTEVLVAVDRGWVRFEDALRAAAIVVRRLCPQDIK